MAEIAVYPAVPPRGPQGSGPCAGGVEVQRAPAPKPNRPPSDNLPRYGTTGPGSVCRTIHSCSRFTLSIWW
jgi:hypothetical protein